LLKQQFEFAVIHCKTQGYFKTTILNSRSIWEVFRGHTKCQ